MKRIVRFAAGLFLAFLCVIGSDAASLPAVVINEIMYHPPGTNHLAQWFELFNAGNKVADLSGWQVTKGVGFTFPAGTLLPAGGYLVVAADRATFQTAYPDVTNFVAGWTGKLGHNLEISDASGKAVNAIEFYSEGDWAVRELGPAQYNHQGWIWNAPADGQGASLELINPALPNTYAHNWAPNPALSSTPGRANLVKSTDAAPFVSGVSHWPPIPRPDQSVSVTCRIVDESIATVRVTLNWRIDGAASFNQLPMFDDGVHQDGISADGVYGALIPPQADHVIVEFYITATDQAGHTRKYPSFIPPQNSSRTANLLYQVDSGSYSGAQPVYRIIMTEAERAELYALGRGCPDSDSDAEMNATWITQDGVVTDGRTTQVRYNVGVRNRGHGTRQSNPNNYHINIPEDRLWKGQAGINLNSQYAHSQVIGSAVFRAAGVAMPDSRAVQVRVNSTNLMTLPLKDINSFGSYAANEQYNSDFIKRAFATDPDGNSYRGIRDQVLCVPSLGGVADLSWKGPNWTSYTNAYFKQNNFVANDWSDLIRLIGVLNVTNGTTPASYADDIEKTIDVQEWMRYLAASTLLDNRETSLANGVGDDYALYRGVQDRRLQALPYDLDSVMGRGLSGVSQRSSIFQMTNLPVMDRLVKHPRFAPVYYAQLKDLADTVFASDQMDPMIDRLLGGFVPPETLSNLKSYNASQRAWVLSQIPLSLTATSTLPQVNGYYKSASSTATISGSANVIDTRRVLVNGADANWVAWQGQWSASNVVLYPGINRLTVRALGTNNAEIARTELDIWYDDGTVQPVGGVISSDTHWNATDGPFEMNSTLTIENGATLAIDPGTTVYLGAGASLVVANSGRLLAEGTEAAPIRFTRAPGASGVWGGIVVNGSAGSPESRITHAHIEFNGTTAIHSTGGTVFLDYLTFGTTDKQYVSLDASSFVVSHCHFPTPTAPFEPAHGTGGIKQGGHGVFYRNFFGAPNGYNDVVDFTGGQRGGPIVYFIDNVFAGGGDDALDLDGTDAWVENNIIMHIHQNGAPDSSSAISGGNTGADTSEVTIVGNLIFDCDNAATAKQGNFFVLLNNTIVHTTKQGGNDFASGIVNVRDTTPDFTTFGRGFYLEGNIITDAEQLVRNYDPQQVVVTWNNNILPSAWEGPGTNNFVGDPMLQHIPTVQEAQFNTWEQAQVMREWFSLRPGSPARKSGPDGKDKGGVVPPGAYIAGAPEGTNSATEALISIGINRQGEGIPAAGWPAGAGFVAYKWRLDGGAWSGEMPIGEPVHLSGLSNGVHTLEVAGKTDAGLYENDPLFGDARTVAAVSWTTDTEAPARTPLTIRINEVLAASPGQATNGLPNPDIIELYNYGTNTVDLSGVRVTRNLSQPAPFTFPAGTTVPAGGYLLLYGDAGTNAGFHLGFNVDAQGDAIYLTDTAGRVVDTVEFGAQVPGYSLSRTFDGTWTAGVPTPGEANHPVGPGDPHAVRINEWLADREFAARDSFIELYNTSADLVNLGGFYLSDAAGAPDRYRIPDYSFIAPHGFAVFVADGNDGPGHLTFKLPADVGQIALFDPALQPVDVVSYGPQTTDISEGRSPNGAAWITFFAQPTPGASNPGIPDSGAVTNITRTVQTLVTLTNAWRYNDGGTDLGTAWRAPGYDDGSWPDGNALFYHGNAAGRMPVPIGTTLPFKSPEQTTFYFRTHFNYTGGRSNITLGVTHVIDDGAVVYLNGTEIYRRNMPAGAVSYSTHASSTVSDATLFGPVTLPADALAEGDNVLALEVHQVNASSSDIAMAFALDAVQAVTNVVVTGPEAPRVILNELMAKNSSVAGPGGIISDWLELYNPGTNRADVSGMSLTDDLGKTRKWSFAPGTYVEANARYVVFLNSAAPAGTNNTGFAVEKDGGTIYLFDSPERGGALLDSVRYGIQVPNLSIARVPDGSGAWVLAQPTPEAVNVAAQLGSPQALRINEWMANPSAGDDWFELYNSGSLPVPLGGLFITDDLTDRSRFHIAPLSFLGNGTNAFVRIEADSSPEKGARHAGFNLSAHGEEIGLYAADGSPIDTVVFGPQLTDVSEGRLPDGSPSIAALPAPSPGASNSGFAPGDSDGDGLPDEWEQAHFGNLLRDGSGDFDGDGLTDRQEYIAGTDPASSADYLRIEALTVSAGASTLSFEAVSGRTYQVEYTSDLSAGAWQVLSEQTASTTGRVQVSDSAPHAGARFYRIKVH